MATNKRMEFGINLRFPLIFLIWMVLTLSYTSSIWALTISISDGLSEPVDNYLYVPVQIGETLNLSCYDLQIQFNPDILEVEDVSGGGSIFIWNQVNNKLFTAFMTLADGGEEFNGELFTITFKVKGVGYSDLIPLIPNDPQNSLYGAMVNPGTFNNIVASGLTVSISTGLSEQTGQIITVPVQINKDINVASYLISIDYDANLLQFQSIRYDGVSGIGNSGQINAPDNSQLNWGIDLNNDLCVDFENFNGVTLSENLFLLYFLVKANGQCNLTPSLPQGVNNNLRGVTVVAGTFDNQEPEPPGPDINVPDDLGISLPADLTGDPDEIITVPVQINNTITIVSYDLSLQYDPGLLELQGLQYDGEEGSGNSGQIETDYGSVLTWNLVNNELTVGFENDDGVTISDKLFNINFKIIGRGQCALTPTIPVNPANNLSGAYVNAGAFNNELPPGQGVFIPSGLIISIPSDLTGCVNDQPDVDIQINKDIIVESYNIIIEYDSDILDLHGLTFGSTTEYGPSGAISEGDSTLTWNQTGDELVVGFMNINGASLSDSLFTINFQVAASGWCEIIPSIPSDPGNNLAGVEVVAGAFNATIVVEEVMSLANLANEGLLEVDLGPSGSPGDVSDIIGNYLTGGADSVTLSVDIRGADAGYFSYNNGNPVPAGSDLTVRIEYTTSERMGLPDYPGLTDYPNAIVVSIKFFDSNGNEVFYNLFNNPLAPPIILEIPLHPDLQADIYENITPAEMLNHLVTESSHIYDQSRYRIWVIRGSGFPEIFIPRTDVVPSPESITVENRNGLWIAIIETTRASDWGSGSGSGAPTLVILDYFKTISISEGVLIEWATLYEMDVLGFNILRSEKENGEYIKINTSLIKARGTSHVGQKTGYTYIDDSVKPGVSYYYRLEEINNNKTLNSYYTSSLISSGGNEGQEKNSCFISCVKDFINVLIK